MINYVPERVDILHHLLALKRKFWERTLSEETKHRPSFSFLLFISSREKERGREREGEGEGERH
ncbi:hypothetical protein OIU76_000433 [Salix suchowensis]|nr:hypothetical protein OIU76_000433 [Salix suchowensis]